MVVDAGGSFPVANQTICLVSEDKQEFTISIEAAKGSQHLAHCITGCDASKPFPLPVIKSSILSLVVEYLVQYRDSKPVEMPKPLPGKPFRDLVTEWEYKYTSQELPIIFELILAANYLDIPGLLDLCCAKVASEIRGRSVEEIRSIFQIENDFTPEEEQQIRDENRWCEKE